MKKAIIFIAAFITASHVHAWGAREQGILAGVVGTLIVQEVLGDQRKQPTVVVRDRPSSIVTEVLNHQPLSRLPQPVEVKGYSCPPGLAGPWWVSYDVHGRPYYVFSGCR